MTDPLWFEAAATMLLAAETGVGMHIKKAATAPASPTMVMNGISGQDFLIGMFILALAMLGAALIIHHGLTA